MPRAAQVDRRAPCTSPDAMTSITAGPGDSDSAISVSTYSQYVSQLTAVSTATPYSGVAVRREHARCEFLQRSEHLVGPLGHQRMATALEDDDRCVGTRVDQR